MNASSSSPPAEDTPSGYLVTAVIDAVVVEHDVRFTLDDLARASRADPAWLCALVDEGALAPEGRTPDDWVFAGDTLRRARTAARLNRDFSLGPAETAVVLDLIDEIASLRRQLGLRGGHAR
jgi:chaperone modulatory protein CbpM